MILIAAAAKGAENIYFDAVRKAVKRGENRFPFRERLFGLKMPLEEPEPEKPVVCLIGEPVIMTSLAASLQLQTGVVTHVYGATEDADIFLGEKDAPLSGEEELETALRKAASRILITEMSSLPDAASFLCLTWLFPAGSI